MNSQKIEVSDAQSSTAPTNDDQRGNRQQKDTRTKHKGRGAKTRAAEKFRERKNEETYSTRMEANRAFRDSFSSSVDGVESALKSLSVGSAFFQPPSEITISQAGIPELVDATINYMADMKVPYEEGGAQDRAGDRGVLLNVTKLQVYAKCEMARRRGPFGREPGSNDLVNLIVSQLSVGFKSSAAYLENIGACEVDGQQTFPTLPENPAAVAAPVGWTRTRVTVDEGTLYVNLVGIPEIDVNSGDVLLIAADRRRFVLNERIPIGETIEKYTRLLSRVAKKMASAIIPIDLSSGTGTCAQLVGSKDIEAGYTAERQAWCHRRIPQMSLVLGAGFQYGYNSTDNWHLEEKKVAITGQISPCAFYTKLMQVNGKVPVGQVEAR